MNSTLHAEGSQDRVVTEVTAKMDTQAVAHTPRRL